jgi:hypothetical protein
MSVANKFSSKCEELPFRGCPKFLVIDKMSVAKKVFNQNVWNPHLLDHSNKIYRTGANVIKLFTAVSYNFSQLAEVFVPGKPFHPSVMFCVRPGAYPRVEHLKGASLG